MKKILIVFGGYFRNTGRGVWHTPFAAWIQSFFVSKVTRAYAIRPYGKTRRFRFLKGIILFYFVILVSSCAEDDEPAATENNNIVVIENFLFTPQELTVTAGQTVFFVNNDQIVHQILSQTDENLFDDSGDFSSEMIDSGQTGFVEIPSSAESGDVFFYYCGFLEDGMATPNGSFVVE